MNSASLERERAHACARKTKKTGERTWDAGKEPVTKGRGTAFAREPSSMGWAPDSRPGGRSAMASPGGCLWRDGGDAREASSPSQATSTLMGAAERPATAERPKRPELGIYMSPAVRVRMAAAEAEAAARAAKAEVHALAREKAAAEAAKAKAEEEEAALEELHAAAERMEAMQLAAAPAAAAPAAAQALASAVVAASVAASGREPWPRSLST